jgi:hypothetical protein
VFARGPHGPGTATVARPKGEDVPHPAQERRRPPRRRGPSTSGSSPSRAEKTRSGQRAGVA